jgi:glycosyltransferase involved in cell wall biosynthesis
MAPLISVIMPVHNGVPFVAEAVRSILEQSFGDFECVIIDDASTDESPEIVASFADPRVVLLRNERQLGITGTLNRGIAAARGRLLARMDADDVAHPDRFARQQEFLLALAGPGVVGSNVILIDRNGVETGSERHPASAGDIHRTILVHNPFAHGAVMLTRSLLDLHGVYDPAFLHNEDYDLWLRLEAAGTAMANLQEFLLRRRIHDRNITVSRERELVGFRCRTLAHAVFTYYRNPWLAIHLVRPAAAYLARWRP